MEVNGSNWSKDEYMDTHKTDKHRASRFGVGL